MTIFRTLSTTKAIGRVVFPCAHCQCETTHTAFAWTRFLSLFSAASFEIGKRHQIGCTACGRRRTAVGTLKFWLIQLELSGRLPHPDSIPAPAREQTLAA